MAHSNANDTISNTLFHLTGGLRAQYDSNIGDLRIFPIKKDEAISFNKPNLKEASQLISKLGLKIYGAEEMPFIHGLSYRIWHPFGSQKYKIKSVVDNWNAIAAGAKNQKDEEASLLMRQIGFSLLGAGRRLRDLSDNYYDQLSFAINDNDIRSHRFLNTEVIDLYLTCHSFLTEACSARDYLAKFLAKYLYGGLEIDSMAKLLIKKPIPKFEHLAHKYFLEVNSKENDDGWLAKMSQYRNIIVHRAPLSHLRENELINLVVSELANGLKLPQIMVGIPSDPYKPNKNHLVDVLMLFHFFYIRLLDFSKVVATLSPYEPFIRLIDEKDVKEVRKISS